MSLYLAYLEEFISSVLCVMLGPWKGLTAETCRELHRSRTGDHGVLCLLAGALCGHDEKGE